MTPDRDTRYSMPMPKINIPPPPGSGVEVPEMMPSSSAWLAPAPAAPTRADPAGNRRDAIRWDFRFVASLILLTLMVNVALAFLLRQHGEQGTLFITRANAADEGLPQLAPAAGDDSGTTIYLQDKGRAQTIERLGTVRNPGLVSLPPTTPSLTPDEQTETGE